MGCAAGTEASKVGEVEVKMEEKPKWQEIVGLSGEVLRHQGMGTTFTQINFFSVLVYLDSSPLSSLLYQKLLGC